jgi:ABC-2 type transport system permease protein
VSPLLRASLWSQRRAVVGWAIGLAAVAAIYAAVYPSIQQSAADLNAYLEKMPEAFRNVVGADYTSPAGYLRAELFAVLGPILFLVYTVGAGGRAIAGEEEARSLDLLLVTPLSRMRVIADKAMALLLSIVALGVFLFVVVVAIGRPFDLIVPIPDVAAACLMLILLGLVFASLALAIGAATGRRAWAYAVSGGFAVVTYVANALGPSVSWLGWARPLSPFRWYLDPDPLTTGLHPENVAVLLVITTVATAFSLWVFGRRDLAA